MTWFVFSVQCKQSFHKDTCKLRYGTDPHCRSDENGKGKGCVDVKDCPESTKGSWNLTCEKGKGCCCRPRGLDEKACNDLCVLKNPPKAANCGKLIS